MYTVLTLDDEKTYTDFTYNIMITENGISMTIFMIYRKQVRSHSNA